MDFKLTANEDFRVITKSGGTLKLPDVASGSTVTLPKEWSDVKPAGGIPATDLAAHAASHATGGGDALTPADIGAAALADLRYDIVTPVPSPSGGVNLIDRGPNYISVDASGYTPWTQYAGDSGFTTPEWDSAAGVWVVEYGGITASIDQDYDDPGATSLSGFVVLAEKVSLTIESFTPSQSAQPGELTGTVVLRDSLGTFSVQCEDVPGGPDPQYGQGSYVYVYTSRPDGSTYSQTVYCTAANFEVGDTLSVETEVDRFFTFVRDPVTSTGIYLPAPVNGKVRDLLLLLDIAAGATLSGLSFDPGTGKTWVADGGSFPVPEAGKLNLYAFTDLPTGRVLVSRRVVADVSAGGGS